MRVDSETGLILHRGVLTRSLFAVRLLQLVNFLFGVLYALLLARFVLAYIGARDDSGFVRFVREATHPFYAPFDGIVRNGSDAAGHPLVWSVLVAVVAYAVLHAAIRGLLRLIMRPSAIVDEDD